MKKFAILCLSFFLIIILSGCSGSNPDQLPAGYAVTYEGNRADGGTVPLDSNSYIEGQTATVLNNTGSLVKTGYNFNGWNTAADGTGDTCIAGQTLSIGSTNVVLYAIWAIDIYIVTYEGNGSDAGTVPLDTNSYIEGQTVTVLDNTGSLLKTGYTFSGWNTIADGSGESYTAGETFPMGLSNVVMYAMWTNNIYTVTYDGNGSTGGTVPTDSAAYIQGQTVTVLDNTGSLLKTGYTFTGWNTAADGSGDTYISSQTFSMALSNVTLYAKWDVLINRQWYSITSSADGTKLAALGFEQIYTSTDSGATWTARDSSRQWNSITSSADGTKLAATVVGGQIYTSTNSGVTWTARDSSRQWNSITSSADGTKLAATVVGGQIYTSTDSGITWTARDSSRQWIYITSSADGTKLAAMVVFGNIYISIDSGVTWTPRF